MKILFYAPFKPLDHPHPSGDLITAQGLVDFLRRRGHTVWPASALRSRWIWRKPFQWPAFWAAARRIQRHGRRWQPQLWLTYHSYYKAPDLLGPDCAKRLAIPYAIFQGMYATKRRRNFRTWPGFHLNRRALVRAQHVFNNRRADLLNLARLVPPEKLTYIKPGIDTALFRRDSQARQTLRRRWAVGDTPVILAAAMFRADVKSEGLAWVIETCRRLQQQAYPFHLVLIGEGRMEAPLRALAQARLPGRHHFTGLVPRGDLYQYYSAADLFVFPGIRESLGMVYLEAQACGLPVVAFDNGGIPEVVQDRVTGLLTPFRDRHAFCRAVAGLLDDPPRRRAMGAAAVSYVRRHHDLQRNYREFERVLTGLASLAAGKRDRGTARAKSILNR